ncbi:MAG: 4Fe-4S binding protein [Desulfobacterota bacterium]|nr:4Fe-4S binding protein [Thermodesulfobacteriota bacterium]MDW8002291.1 4Fe-4S binding protein [Deltaproteobacteria bacterium]
MTKIDIYRAWCKCCGICVAFCPKGVLAKDELGYPFVEKPDECIRCRWCELRCPDFAITVLEGQEDFEKKEQTQRNSLTGK